MRVAFIGIGRMGRAMATNVAAAGHELVLFNRTRAKADALAAEIDASVVDTPGAAAAFADAVITMLSDIDAVRDAYVGHHGVADALSSETIAIDMGTTGSEGVAWLNQTVASAGATLVDAPVSGSTAAARDGSLTIMAGGPAAAVDRVRPVLDVMGSRVFHLGPTGSGAAMKLAVNGIIYALGQAVSESLVLAERVGIDRSVAYDVLENSAIAAPMVTYRRDQYVNPEAAPVMLAMRLAVKDLQLMAALAGTVGAPVPQAQTNIESYGRAIAAGLGEHDMAGLAEYFRSLAEATG